MVRYEWVIEQLDRADGDEAEIVGVDHRDTYAEAVKAAALEDYARIALVRDRGDDVDGLQCRSWAYIEAGVLPEFLLDANCAQIARVPVKFRKQFEAA